MKVPEAHCYPPASSSRTKVSPLREREGKKGDPGFRLAQLYSCFLHLAKAESGRVRMVLLMNGVVRSSNSSRTTWKAGQGQLRNTPALLRALSHLTSLDYERRQNRIRISLNDGHNSFILPRASPCVRGRHLCKAALSSSWWPRSIFFLLQSKSEC